MKKFVERSISNQLISAAKEFPVISLTGPRQTGKSTLLQKIFSDYHYISLDDPLSKKALQDDPQFYFKSNKKIIIDEIQYLPEILPYIKAQVDKHREINGQFLLTGSQYFPLMANLTESLAGRISIHELLGLSIQETPWINYTDRNECFLTMFNGFYPETIVHKADRNRFYSSYLQTYLERDIRQITSIQDIKTFQNFLELLASRTGNLLNINEISKECGISATTAKRWLSLLETSRIIYLLRPYKKNITKRIVKTPKIYFTDTGLLAYILRYQDHTTLMQGPQAGAFFENLIIIEALKHKLNHNKNYELYFYRDSNHNEIDLIIDSGLTLHLIEIKLTNTPKPDHLATLKKTTLSGNDKKYLLSFSDDDRQMDSNTRIMSWNKIFSSIIIGM